MCKYCDGMFFECKNGLKIFQDLQTEDDLGFAYYAKQKSGQYVLYVGFDDANIEVPYVKYCTMCGRKL